MAAADPTTYKEIENGKLPKGGFGTERMPSDGYYGMTYLHIACQKGDLRVARRLLELGANATARDNDDRTPLMLACWGAEEKRAELVECLLEQADVRTCIDNTAMGDYFGQTALHFAARFGNAAVVRVLLRCGADATKLEERGLTALMFAQTHKKLDVAQLLARPEVKDLTSMEQQ